MVQASHTLLYNRDGVFYYRKAVPENLRAIVGKRELLISLRTKDRETAKARLNAKAVEADRILSAARAKLTLLKDAPEKIADRWKADALKLDLERRQDAPRRSEEGRPGAVAGGREEHGSVAAWSPSY